MYNEIYKKIVEYNEIVIARHIGVDPDALCSQLALKDSIKLTFPEKKVLAIGTGSAKFNSIGKLDKIEKVNNALLIVIDTPDKRRVDSVDFSQFAYKIKIDHHPFIENFCDLECIEDDTSSSCEILINMILNTPLICDENIAQTLYIGLVSDSNRFLFDSCKAKTFKSVSTLLEKYPFSLSQSYEKLYLRPMNEVRLEGYISLNMNVTENGLGYIKISDQVISEFGVDSASAGNMINNYNYIKDVLVWVTMTEDIKNDQIRISIRSRGPEINKLAESYGGGGHKMAAGVKVKTFDEAMKFIKELDNLLKEYNEIL